MTFYSHDLENKFVDQKDTGKDLNKVLINQTAEY